MSKNIKKLLKEIKKDSIFAASYAEATKEDINCKGELAVPIAIGRSMR